MSWSVRSGISLLSQLMPDLSVQVSVTAREDVPAFGPPLPSPPVFQKVKMSSTILAILGTPGLST